MEKIIFHVEGMHCNSCKLLIEDAVGEIEHVDGVDVNIRGGTATVSYNKLPNKDDIIRVIEESGYKVADKKITHARLSTNIKDYRIFILSLLGFGLLYFILKETGIFSFDLKNSSPGLSLVLLVGLTAGFSSCIAVVGGLIMAVSARRNAQNEDQPFSKRIVPHLRFNVGRIVGFGILGGILGLFGSVISLSPSVMSVMTLVIGVVMLLLGITLTNISPKLSTINLSLPTGKLFKKKETDLIDEKPSSFLGKYGKAMGSGALTFFLPCGFTFSMQLYAIGTGDFLMGMAVMSLFAIGTLPGLLSIGSLTSIFKGKTAKIAYQAIGVLVVLFGIYNISNTYGVLKTKIIPTSSTTQTFNPDQTVLVNMVYGNDGLTPAVVNLELGKRYKIIIDVQRPVYGCMTTIYLPGLDEHYQEIKVGVPITFNVDATTPGEYEFVCAAMGMSHGSKVVIK